MVLMLIGIGTFAGFKLKRHYLIKNRPNTAPYVSSYDINMEHLTLRYDMGSFDTFTTILRENKNKLTQIRIREMRAEGRRHISESHEIDFMKTHETRIHLEEKVVVSRSNLYRWSTNVHEDMLSNMNNY